MKNFNKLLYQKNVVLLSDYINYKEYTKTEMDEEKKFLRNIELQINSYKIDFTFLQTKSARSLCSILKTLDPKNTIIFNWCEQLEGNYNMWETVIDILKEFEFTYTGADTRCYEQVKNKENIKKTLLKNKLNTPKYCVISDVDNIPTDLEFPLIVKSASRHASAGFSKKNLVRNRENLTSLCGQLIDEFKESLLIEKYIPGKEYTILVWGNGENVTALKPVRVNYWDTTINEVFTSDAKFNTRSKEYLNTEYTLSKNIETQEIYKKLVAQLIDTYKLLNFKDYARFEIRLSDEDFYIIDTNANPNFYYDSAILMSANDAGYNTGEFILQICEFALLRER